MKKPTTTIQPSTTLSSSSHFSPRTPLKLHPSPSPYKPHKLSLKILCSQAPNPPSNQTLTLVSIFRAIPDWADRIKERGMQQNRKLYSHDDWLQHRSSLRHIRHLLTSLSSRVILSLVPPVIAFTSVAAAIASYNTAVSLHWLPGFLPVLRASPLPYQLTAPALALLLVFRTEASYSRFDEGRKAWTKVVAGTNDFARQAIASVDSSDALLKEALLQYIIAFPVALKCHVIYGSDIGRDLKNLLEVDDLAVVLSSKHRPRCIIGFISQSIQLLNLEEEKRHVLESKISCFHEGIGVCEQLMGVPIPLSYTRLTSRFLVLWHLTLPIILWDDCNWIVVPATFISAASLFCIEELLADVSVTLLRSMFELTSLALYILVPNTQPIDNKNTGIYHTVGVLIEEPFPMLALDDLCKLVQNNIQEAMTNEKMIRERLVSKRKKVPREHSPNGLPAS